MVRAVLDASVLASALLRPAGPPGVILRLLLEDGAFELVLSPAMAAEAARALRYPKIRGRLPPRFVPEDWVEDLAASAVLVADGPGPGVCRDPADEIYLAAAVAAGADFVVSGDDDLLALRAHGTAAVVTPRRFLEILASAGG